MARKLIVLHNIPSMMLVVEHPSGVYYANQVGGVVNAKEEVEGVLAPLDVSGEAESRIANCSYPQGTQGISSEIADTIDAVLASEAGGRFLKVDRGRLSDSWEAWVYVVFDSPERYDQQIFGPYFGEAYGFAAAKGVLTWCNSD